MTTPTISEYTAHLREDKANMRAYLDVAGVETSEQDTFTELAKACLAQAGAIPNVFVQPTEPAIKKGIWIKRDNIISQKKINIQNTNNPYKLGVYLPNEQITDTTGFTRTNTQTSAACWWTYENKLYILYLSKDNVLPHDVKIINMSTNSVDRWVNIPVNTDVWLVNNITNSLVGGNDQYMYIIGGGGTKSNLTYRKRRIRISLTTGASSRLSDLSDDAAQYAYCTNYKNMSSYPYICGANYTTTTASSASNYYIIHNVEDGTTVRANAGGGTLGTLCASNGLLIRMGGGSIAQNGGPNMNQIYITFMDGTGWDCRLPYKMYTYGNAAFDGLDTIYVWADMYDGSYGGNPPYDKAIFALHPSTRTYELLTTNVSNYYTAASYVLYVDHTTKKLKIFYPVQLNVTTHPVIRSVQLEQVDYNEECLVLWLSPGTFGRFTTEILSHNNMTPSLKHAVGDAWYYSPTEGYDENSYCYYGNGESWVRYTHYIASDTL